MRFSRRQLTPGEVDMYERIIIRCIAILVAGMAVIFGSIAMYSAWKGM